MQIRFPNDDGRMAVSVEEQIERPIGSGRYYTRPHCWVYPSPPLEYLKELRRILSQEIKRQQNVRAARSS